MTPPKTHGDRATLTFAALLLAMAAAPLALVVAADREPAPSQIVIESFAFEPRDLTVAPGTTVTWVNMDETPHTVVTDDKAIRSGALDTGDQFSFRFDSTGTYAYHCSLHPHMTGTVIVR